MAPNPKRRNHEVPHGYLKSWQLGTPPTLHYYDIAADCLGTDRSARSLRFAHDYLYVPRVGTARLDALEDWFGGRPESGLAALCRAARERNPAGLTATLVEAALTGAITLAHRSRYAVERLEQAFAGPTPPAPLGARSPHQAALAHLVHAMAVDLAYFRPWRFTVFYDLPPILLTCDRPFAWRRQDRQATEAAFMPLGPSALLAGTPRSSADQPRLEWVAGAADPLRLASTVNLAVAERARHWVIGYDAGSVLRIRRDFPRDHYRTASQGDPISSFCQTGTGFEKLA